MEKNNQVSSAGTIPTTVVTLKGDGQFRGPGCECPEHKLMVRSSKEFVGIDTIRKEDVSVFTSTRCVLRFTSEGKLFWKEREVETDQELREAIKGLAVDAALNNNVNPLALLVERLCIDLNDAHSTLMSVQNVAFPQKCDWPACSSAAQDIRMAERLLCKKLAKTNDWTLYPELPMTECEEHHT